jgi:ABC-type sugar transport system substrate-binding protein
VLIVLAGALAAYAVGAASGHTRASQADVRIALILPDFTKNSAILGVKQGADDAAKKLGVTLITTGSGSADGQVKAVENAIAAKVDAILYDSISGDAFTNAVKEANKAGIPVVCYVACAPGGKHASKIDFDFKGIGVPLGEWAGKALLAGQKKDGGTPVLAIVDTNKTDLAVKEIYKGFYEGIKKSGVKYKQVMSPPTAWDPAKGLTYAGSLLASNPRIDVLYCNADTIALACYQAMKAAGRTNIPFAGANGDCPNLKLLLDGIQAYEVILFLKAGAAPALEAALKAAQGKPVAATGKVPIQGLTTAQAKAILAGTTKAPAGLPTREMLKAAQAGCK